MDLWLLLLVMSLATYRLTRLVVADTFPPVLWLRDRLAGGWRLLTEPEQAQYAEARRGNELVWGAPIAEGGDDPRAAFPEWMSQVQRVEGENQRYVKRARWSPFWLAELLSCPWCASGWLAAGVTAGTLAVVGLPVPLLVWPAVWAVGALIAARE